jgi:hypothetical protein
MRASTLALMTGILALLLAGCATSQPEEPAALEPEKAEAPQPEVPLSSRAPTPTGPVEVVPKDEEDQIRKVLSLLESNYSKRERQRPVLRPFFGKNVGCAAGSFTVSKTIPLKYRWGVFSDPKKGFPVWARFSEERGLRGLGIKMIGVVGEKLLPEDEKKTQDYVFQSSPSFFARDVSGFLRSLSSGRAFYTHDYASAGPLGTEYFTVTASKLGDAAVKYRLSPADCRTGKPDPGGDQPLGKTLARRKACFSFEVQEWKNEMETPIEDAAIAWNTPFARIGWVILEKASDASFKRNSQACEKMSFNPWHAIIDHPPMGGIARLQKEAYRASARIRRKMNNWAEEEPK